MRKKINGGCDRRYYKNREISRTALAKKSITLGHFGWTNKEPSLTILKIRVHSQKLLEHVYQFHKFISLYKLTDQYPFFKAFIWDGFQRV